MKIAMFQGYDAPPSTRFHVRRRRFSGLGFGALTTAQLQFADDALEAARRGRTWWRAVFALAPSIETLEGERMGLDSSDATDADLQAYMKDASIAMGPDEYVELSKRWPPERFVESGLRPAGPAEQIVSGDLTPLTDPLKVIPAGVKWIVVGLVAYAVIQVAGFIPKGRK